MFHEELKLFTYVHTLVFSEELMRGVYVLVQISVYCEEAKASCGKQD